MSTRTNIVIDYGQTRVYLYRHCDGYLTGAGADLAEKLVAAMDPERTDHAERLLRALLDEHYAQQSYETSPKRVYELTDGVHGDVEYLYHVSFGGYRSKPEIGYRKVGILGKDPAPPAFALGTPAEFVAEVNREILEQNKRLAKLRLEQPAYFGDSTDQPEIAYAG